MAQGRWDPRLPWLANKEVEAIPILRDAWIDIVTLCNPDGVADCLALALGPTHKSASTTGIVETSKYLSAACNSPTQAIRFENELPYLGPEFSRLVIQRLLVLRPTTRADILSWSQHQSRAQLRIYLRTIKTLP
jgi:hypothetical protein